ncbi:MAG: hypothetical protein ACRETP_09380 [Steroidobacteraceae bacterium]
MGETPALPRAQVVLAEFQRISFTHTPRLERRSGQNDPKGISDAS